VLLVREVGDRVGAEAGGVREVLSPAGPDDQAGAEDTSRLHGQPARRAGCPEHQDGLTRLEVSTVVKRQPPGHARTGANGQAGGVDFVGDEPAAARRLAGPADQAPGSASTPASRPTRTLRATRTKRSASPAASANGAAPHGYCAPGRPLRAPRQAERKAYRGSKIALSLVAFYADCRHEVLKVKSGYRVTLTYNLLLHGDSSRPAGDDGTVAELADLLREHFSTPVPRYYGGPAADPPNRLVYLLDHEYTPRALSWRRLKGADASRVALLQAAAGKADAQAAAATLAPFWDGALCAQAATEGSRTSGLFGKALQVALALTNAETAAMLLRPLRIENLTDTNVNSLGTIADAYGQQWTAHLLRTWFGGDEPTWAYVGEQQRPQWVADWLPSLCTGLHATGGAGAVTAERILDLAWEWLGTSRAVVRASPTWPPTARPGSAPGSPAHSAHPATGRSACPRAAAPATCATPSPPSAA
jgi:hypothetical protein